MGDCPDDRIIPATPGDARAHDRRLMISVKTAVRKLDTAPAELAERITKALDALQVLIGYHEAGQDLTTLPGAAVLRGLALAAEQAVEALGNASTELDALRQELTARADAMDAAGDKRASPQPPVSTRSRSSG